MRGVAHAIRLLAILVEEEVVDNDHLVAAHSGHFGQAGNVVEVVRRDATGDDIEALVGEWKLAPADDVGLHTSARNPR